MDLMCPGKNGKDTHVAGLDPSVSLQRLVDNQCGGGLRCIKENNKACLVSLVSCQQSL